MPRRKGLFERTMTAPFDIAEKGFDVLFGDEEPPRPPERRAQRCPVCEGAGIVPASLYNVGPASTGVQCRTCNGRGMVR